MKPPSRLSTITSGPPGMGAAAAAGNRLPSSATEEGGPGGPPGHVVPSNDITGVDGNRTHHEPRERPVNGFEGRGTPSEAHCDTSSYENDPAGMSPSMSELVQQQPELAAVITAWPSLPEAIRVGILAMVRSTADTNECQ